MLLLTAVTFGGQDSVGIFDHLPDDESALLKHRALELLKIPREKRIPLLVQEIKRLVTTRRNQGWAADPEALARVLQKERPALVEVVLRALPQGTAQAVRGLLPQAAQAKLVREVKPQILNLVRWRLEEAVGAGRKPGFKFSDLLLLKSRELLTVCDRLGVRALAQAMAGLPSAEREELFNKLGPDLRPLAVRASQAAAQRPLSEGDARSLIAMHAGDREPSDAVRSAGAQRLARACLAQSPEFAARIVERHPGAMGQLLVRWIREERPKVNGRIDGGRADVVAELDRLEQKGVIDRPVRLPPPPKLQPQTRASAAPPDLVAAAQAPRASLPGGKLLVPARPSTARRPSSAIISPVLERPRTAERPRPSMPGVPVSGSGSGFPQAPAQGGSSVGMRSSSLSSAPSHPSHPSHPSGPSIPAMSTGERARLPAPRVPPVLERLRPPSRAAGEPVTEQSPVAPEGSGGESRASGAGGPWRDPIAMRQARRAGVPVPREDEPRRRDPIAEREARRAGVGRAPEDSPHAPRPRGPADSTTGTAPGPSRGGTGSRMGRPRSNLEHKVVKARPEEPRVPAVEGQGEVTTMPGNIRRAGGDRPPAGGDRTSLQRAPRGPIRPGGGRGGGSRDGSR